MFIRFEHYCLLLVNNVCIQVCYNLTDMNMDRELNGLKIALDYFKMKEGTIVTHNQTDLFEKDGTTIKLIPAWKYFLMG
jgi:predicted AAA+ superfamily ATPase